MLVGLSEGWTDVLTVTGVALAAIAAITGVVSVVQGWQSWRKGKRPHLQAFGTRSVTTGRLQIVIQNTGGAPARDPTFFFVIRDMYVTGPASPGLLGPGREVGLQVNTPVADHEPLGGVMACRSQNDRTVWAWTIRGSPCHWRRRPWSKDPPTVREIFAKRYEAAHGTKFRQVAYTLEGPR